jgi:hypothetical protein
MMNIMEHDQLPHPRVRLPTAIDLHGELNALTSSRFPWMYELSKCAPQEALRDLGVAFTKSTHRPALRIHKTCRTIHGERIGKLPV